MKLIDGCSVGKPDGAGGRMVVVGLKLDSESRKLLTWALVELVQPGDSVVALHVLDSISEDSSSLISLVKTFNSFLTVYEGFCNLKQVELKLKVCRGSPVKKILNRELQFYSSATLIVGTSENRSRIRSSMSVAKFCARKLGKNFNVIAVNNGRVVFQSERINHSRNQDPFEDDDACKKSIDWIHNSLHQDLKILTSDHPPNCLLKSGSDSWKIYVNEIYTSYSPPPPVLDHPGSKFSAEFFENYPKNPMAIMPVRTHEALLRSKSSVVREMWQPKSSWSFLRRLVPNQHQMGKPVKTIPFSRVLSLRSSAFVCPDQKQHICSHDEDQNDFSLLSPSHSLKSIPKELPESLHKFAMACRLFTYPELFLATSNFAPENIIGRGGSSRVYWGCLPDGKELAVKILKPSEDVFKEFMQEMEIITTLHHKNIISLQGFCFEDNHLLLVYNFLSRGSLEENLHGSLKDSKLFGWQERFKVAVGVAEALHYLHNESADPVIHRDVKSSNILLSDDFEPRLSDFGLSSWGSSSSHVTCSDVTGTFGYLAPEYFMHGKVSDKIDVYAFSVVLLELLSGRKSINNDCPKGQESLVMWAKPILKNGKVSQLLDPSLGSDYNHDQIGRMILAATLCIKRAPKHRPHMGLILKLLQGNDEITNWARRQVLGHEELDAEEEEPSPTNIQSYLNTALLDLEDDSSSMSSGDQSVSLEDYLQVEIKSQEERLLARSLPPPWLGCAIQLHVFCYIN